MHPSPTPSSSEHFLDIVNADFSSDEEVDKILDAWEERGPAATKSETTQIDDDDDGHGDSDNDSDVQQGVAAGFKKDRGHLIKKMFQRHALIIVRDPLLYVGRALVFLILNMVFGFVYWKARDADQSQALNKHFLNLWYCGIACNSKCSLLFSIRFLAF
mgnify:CR=1 FL=1